MSSPHVVGGDPERELRRPSAKAELSPGFPTETFGNDRVLVLIVLLSDSAYEWDSKSGTSSLPARLRGLGGRSRQ